MKNLLLTGLITLGSCLVAQAAPVSEAAKSAQSAAGEYKGAVMNCDMGWCFDHMYPPIKRTMADRYASRTQSNNQQEVRRVMGLEKESSQQAQARMERNMAALRQHYVNMGNDMLSGGFKVERFVIGAPYAEYELISSAGAARAVKEGSVITQNKRSITKAEDIKWQGDRSRLVVLPTTLWINIPDPRTGRRVRIERKDYIYAVRDEAYNRNINTRGTEPNKWYFIDSNTPVNTLRTYFPTLPLNLRTPDTGDRPLH